MSLPSKLKNNTTSNYTFLDELKDKMNSHKYSEARKTYAQAATLESRIVDLEDKFTTIRDKFEDVLNADTARHNYTMGAEARLSSETNARKCRLVLAKINQLQADISALREKIPPIYKNAFTYEETPYSDRMILLEILHDITNIFRYITSIMNFCKSYRYDRRMNDAALDPAIVKRFDDFATNDRSISFSIDGMCKAEALKVIGISEEIAIILEECVDVTPTSQQYFEGLIRYVTDLMVRLP